MWIECKSTEAQDSIRNRKMFKKKEKKKNYIHCNLFQLIVSQSEEKNPSQANGIHHFIQYHKIAHSEYLWHPTVQKCLLYLTFNYESLTYSVVFIVITVCDDWNISCEKSHAVK